MNFIFSTGDFILLLLVVGSNSGNDTALYGQPCNNSNSTCLLTSRALCRNKNESQANGGAMADVYGGDFPGGAKENGICVCTRDRPWYSTKDRKCKYKSDADDDDGGSGSSAKPKSSGAGRIVYQYYQPISLVACAAAIDLFLPCRF